MPSATLDGPSIAAQFRLDGRVALVTGGAGHLGSAASDVLAELGAHVLIASRDVESCERLASRLRSLHEGARVEAVQLDICDSGAVDELASSIGTRFGSLDILANFSWSGRKNSLESITRDDWDQDIEVSLTAAFWLVKLMLPVLSTPGGTVLNVASMYGLVAPDHRLYPSNELANPPSYGAAKAGVIQLTRYLSSFLSPQGIRANCLAPGAFPFPETLGENPEFARRLQEKVPLGRTGNPHEIKGAVALLCSDASTYMTGQVITVDGGWTMW